MIIVITRERFFLEIGILKAWISPNKIIMKTLLLFSRAAEEPDEPKVSPHEPDFPPEEEPYTPPKEPPTIMPPEEVPEYPPDLPEPGEPEVPLDPDKPEWD